MFSLTDNLAHPYQQYVIAINCCVQSSVNMLIRRLKMLNVECIGVLAYEAVKSFRYYFENLDVTERLPLLFIFSEKDVCLVHDYAELEAAAHRFAA